MKKLLICALAAGLSGCSLADVFIKSSFETPSSSGTFSNLDSVFRSGTGTNAIGTYAFAVGDSGGTGFRAHAGIVPGAVVATPPPSSGIATMSGTYQLATVTGINISYSDIQGFANSASGSITLTADFGAQTLTGSSGNFTVDGNFEGTDLSGSIDYGGTSATLDGLMGADAALGVFHGRTDTSLIAGGFAVE